MESLKLLRELFVMSENLKIPTLQHFFKNFDISTSRTLQQSALNLHMNELESADARSAYGQFSDWLYGWNVTDGTDFDDKSIEDHFRTFRKPRDIDISSDREKVEAQRILDIYETLYQISKRSLKKYYIDIDDDLPKIGKGVHTFFQGQMNENNDYLDEEKDVDELWANKSNDDLDLNDDKDDNEVIKNPQQNVKKKDITVRRASVLKNRYDEEVLSEESTNLEINEEKRAVNVILEEDEEELDDDEMDEQNENEPQQEFEETPPENEDTEENDTKNSAEKLGSSDKLESSLSASAKNPGTFEFMKPKKEFQEHEFQAEEIRRDINHIYFKVDRSADFTLITICNLMAIMSFSELLGNQDNYLKYCNLAHEISMDFVSNTLKSVWDLLNKELPGKIELKELRDPNKLRLRIKEILSKREENGRIPKFKIRKIHFKFALIHDLLTMMDIFIFPNFVEAHKNGLKSAQFSTFDSSLWITGGCDSVIRIHDIRKSSMHLCLAQYVGHKSIITDVHFSKKEGQIISSSFDRTIKIWNSQSAACEKTLTGHSDSILSCDYSLDGKYIVSGSADCRIKLWDFETGECINTIKKHSNWIKKVRFSPDGKFIISASLDSKMIIWDLKLMAFSRNPTPLKVIDVHLDYILDIAMSKNLLITTCRDRFIRMFDYVSGALLKSYDMSPSWAACLCFSDNGEYFATGSFDNNVTIFKTSDFTKVRQIRVFNFGITCIRFPNDLSYITIGTAEGFLQQIML